jgi:Zeta toxin
LASWSAQGPKFRAAGYRIETAIVAVPEASSRLGGLDRFWNEFQRDGMAGMWSGPATTRRTTA